MNYDEISFENLNKETYLKIREFIRTALADRTSFGWDERYSITAWHQLYNKLRGKENCHVLTKSHQDHYTFSRTLERARKTIDDHLAKKTEKEESHVGSTS